MFSSLRRALVGLAVIAASTVVTPVTTSMVTASDGTIDVTGWSPSTGGLAGFASQFTVNGTSVDFRATASAPTSGGGLMVAGYVGDMDWYQTHMALVRITSAGALDTNFGSNGIVILDRGLDNSSQQIYAAAEAIYPTSGGFLVGGWSGAFRMGANATLTKVDNDGNVVSGWGVSGTITSHVPSGWYPSFSVDGSTILMSSDDSSGSAYVHRFSEATGAPVAVGMGANNYLTINTAQAPFSGRIIKSVALGTQSNLIAVSVGGSPATVTVHRYDLGFASLTDSTATSIPADIFKGIVRAGNSGFWLVGSSGNQNNSLTSFTLLNPDGTFNPTYGPNSDGYVSISNFSLWSGGAWNGTGDKLLILGRRMGSDSISRFLTDGNPDSSFTNGVNPPGVATASSQCNIGTYGWLVPTSNGGFFQVSGQAFVVGGQYRNGIRALKWTSGGLAATACTGQPPSATVSPMSATISGTTGTPIVSNTAPTLNNFLSTPTFTLSQFSGSLPAGLTFNSQNGVISGTPTADSMTTVFFDVSNGSQTASYSVSFNITSAQNNPNPNPNQPPACTVGALTVTGSQPVLDSSWGTSGWVTFQAGGAGYLAASGIVPTSDNAFVLISGTSGTNNQAIDIRKFDATGATVNAFGPNGQLVIEDNTIDLSPSLVFRDSTGKIYVLARDFSQGPGGSYVVRLTSTGTLDTGYGTNGILALTGIPGTNLGYVAAASATGDVYLTSSSFSNNVSTTYVSKFSTTGLDTGFGASGSIDTSSFGGREVAVMADGSLLVGGNTMGQLKLAKYSSAGAIDSSWATSGVATFGNPTVSESIRGVVVSGQDVIVSYSIMVFNPNQMGPPSSGTGVAKIVAATGAVDTSFGIDGGLYTPVRSGFVDPFDMQVMSDGSIVIAVFADAGSQDPTAGFLKFSAAGQMDAAFASGETLVKHGTCGVTPPMIVDLGGGSVLFGGGKDQPNNNAPTEAVVGKFTFGAFSAGTPGGGFSGASPSPSPNNNPGPFTPPTTVPSDPDDDGDEVPTDPNRPNLVTDENRQDLVRAPGQGGVVVDGEVVEVVTEVVDVPAAQVRPERRTPAQVNQIRQAANELVQQFTQQLPPGVESTVQVVATPTGAIIRGLVTDANGNPIDVPAEDVVLMRAEDLVVMVGAQAANVSQDGRFQVPVGSTFGLAGSGFGSGEEGEFVVMSTPTLITEFETSEVGTFDKSGTLPQSIPVGDHTLVVATGTTYAVLGIQVVPVTLPVTGSSNDTVLVFALFTVVFGALLVRSRRTLLI